MTCAIVYGSNTGQTETAASDLKEYLGDLVTDVRNITDTSIEDMQKYDVLIIGASTWDIGLLQYDWEDRYPELEGTEWKGKTVAVFGCGDAIGYADTFVDSLGILAEKFLQGGARLVGKVSILDYDFTGSKALCDDATMFLGLPLDNDNEPEKTDERLKTWAAQLKSELAA